MKVLRFMSFAEFEKYRAGEILTNETRHQAKTNATGFCFLNADTYDPQYALHFLSGIVSQDICAIFECKDIFTHASGTFADPHGSFFQSMNVEELCTTEYSDKQLKLVEFCDSFENNWDEDSSDRIFEWKKPNEPIRRRISVIDKNPPVRMKIEMPDTAEQRLADAVAAYMAAKFDLPVELTEGFRMTAMPVMNMERSISGDSLAVELQLYRPELARAI